jgi:sugar phosphate isomerase/epimerase
LTNIGIQISSVRKYLQTPQDVLASFRKVSQIGYRFIQIQWISPAVPAEFIREALQETRLTCIGTQDYYVEVIPHLDEVIAMNDLWGSRNICVSGIPQPYQTFEGCLAFTKELNQYAARLESAGKLLSFHPRASDFFQFDGSNSFDIIRENTQIQFVSDIYQIFKAGLDPVAWLYKVKGRNDLVHFKDGIRYPDGSETLMPVGQGDIAWEPVMQACIDTAVQYAFAEQESWQKDPFECLQESYEYIVRHGIL